MSIAVIIPALVVTAGFFLFAVTMALRAQRHRTSTVVEDLAPEGKVFLKGEVWNAVCLSPVTKGQKVRVVSLEGLVLRVVPLEGPPNVKEG